MSLHLEFKSDTGIYVFNTPYSHVGRVPREKLKYDIHNLMSYVEWLEDKVNNLREENKILLNEVQDKFVGKE